MHNLFLEERKKLQLTGIIDCIDFSETGVTVKTEKSILKIRGQKLHIDSFSVETGEMYITGQFTAFAYFENGQNAKTTLKRIFK